MRIPNWYALDGICDTVLEKGDVIYLCVGLFENSHKYLKSYYSLSSERAKVVLD